MARGAITASRTLPDLPTFEQQPAGTSVGAGWLPIHPDPSEPVLPTNAATAFNPAARLPPKLVAKIEALEFVEMNELLIEAWSTSEGTNAERDQGLFGKLSRRALVTDIAIWSECFCLMAAVLTRRFPAKAPSLFAYMRRVVRASRTFDGQAWVTYDRLFRRQAAANRSLDWATEDQALYNEAFAGRAKATTRCKHCLSDAHSHDQCPDIPWTSMMWPFMPSQALNPVGRQPTPTGGDKETCRRYNEERCFVQRCKYRHVCSVCAEGHPATRCSKHRPAMDWVRAATIRISATPRSPQPVK